ncbi:MAG: hypothetical protein LIO54_03675 [Oscillospiraceae bacterium]|nr:hypothetical protein [Oscillospiraceae bacterium]
MSRGASGTAGLRRMCLILAREENTPVGWWLDLPLRELDEWRRAHNALCDEIAEKRKKKR